MGKMNRSVSVRISAHHRNYIIEKSAKTMSINEITYVQNIHSIRNTCQIVGHIDRLTS